MVAYLAVLWTGQVNKTQHFFGLLVWYSAIWRCQTLFWMAFPVLEAWTWRMPRWWSRSTGLIIHGSQILSKKLHEWNVKSHAFRLLYWRKNAIRMFQTEMRVLRGWISVDIVLPFGSEIVFLVFRLDEDYLSAGFLAIISFANFAQKH